MVAGVLAVVPTCMPPYLLPLGKLKTTRRFGVWANGFPTFLPKDVDKIKDPFARNLAKRIERLPVQVLQANRRGLLLCKVCDSFSSINILLRGVVMEVYKVTFSDTPIMSSCVRPLIHGKSDPVVLLHGFDRYTYPFLEEANLDCWTIDILGWGFSDLGRRPSCDVASKHDHLYQFWKSYIKKPMILVGPSLGAAVAIDFSVSHPEAVSKLVLIDASVYAEGTGELAKLPRLFAYAGVALLKSVPLRFYVNNVAFNSISLDTSLDYMNIGRLHCLYPWWEDATVDFMTSGGYNVMPLIKQVRQRTLIIWGEDDQIISYKLALRLHGELQDATLRQIPDCGHLPHVERPQSVADLIVNFAREKCGNLLQV